MEEKTHQQLKDEAAALGLTFRGNESKPNLTKMIEEFYENEADQDKVQVRDDLNEDQNEDDSAEHVEDTAPKLPNRVMKRVDQLNGAKNKELALKAMVAEARRNAFKKRVVTISSNDTRDNQHVTAVPLFFENQYFALDRIVPLNVPVELEQCLIDIAKTTTIAIHKRELANGTIGKTVYAKKFNISYEDIKA